MTLENEIGALVHEETGVDVSLFRPDTPIAEIGITSADFVMLLFAIEDKFGFEVPETIDASLTIEQLIHFVRDRQQVTVA